jgi:hypothetical protein
LTSATVADLQMDYGLCDNTRKWQYEKISHV